METRARLLPGEYENKTHKVDVKMNGTPEGQIGPMQKALRDLGGINPLIFGAYGETNAAFNKLLSAAAEVGSIRHQAALGVNSPEKAKAVLLWQLRRKLAAAIVRANLNCLQFLMGHLGISRNNSWETSVRRRQQARSRFFNSSDPSVVTGQFRNAYSTYSDRTRDGMFY